MRNALAACSLLALGLAACGAPSGSSGSAPATTTHAATPALPAALARSVPPPPPALVPSRPDAARRITAVAHAQFFGGEAALANGVYYLTLPNGTPFGYYAYLPDSNYIYHFDLGYEYAIDANDGKGGVYFYDFASSHWWYTGRQYPFPYVYDFSLNAFLYYYPDTRNAGHYTANPRYFYNFPASSIVTLPAASPAPTPTPDPTPRPTPTPYSYYGPG